MSVFILWFSTTFGTSGFFRWNRNTDMADAEERARTMLELLISQMAQQEGITERLKATEQMEWVRRMNSVRSRVEEIILEKVIHTF